MQERFEEAPAFGLGSGYLRFQSVAQGHQLFHLGNDAALFGEGREGKLKIINLRREHVLNEGALIQSAIHVVAKY